MKAPRLAAMAALLLLGQASGARAADDIPVEQQAARILYESGRDAFKAGDHEAAVRDLTKAYALFQNTPIQFYLGLALEAAGRCGEAKAHLEALTGKLPPDQSGPWSQALARCRFADVEAMGRSGECDAAQRILESVTWPLDGPLATRKADLVGHCEILKASSLKDAGRCREALQVLATTPAPLVPALAQRRDALSVRCRNLIAGFEPATPAQQAAFLLVQEGAALIDAGRVPEGLARLDKALAIYDHPQIRLRILRGRFARLDCDRAVKDAPPLAEALPEAADELRFMVNWCDLFHVPADAEIAGATRAELLASYRDAWGGGSADVEALRGTLDRYDNVGLRVWLGHAFVDAQRWGDAIAVLEPAAGRAGASEPQVSRDMDLARFARLDLNDAADKAGLYDRFVAARDAWSRGSREEAAKALGAMPKNPFVARYLAEITADHGDCWATAAHVETAGRGAAADPEWVADVTARCQRLQQASMDSAEREFREVAAQAERSRQRRHSVVSGVLLGTGGAGLVVSGIFLARWVGDRDEVDGQLARYRSARDYGAVDGARRKVEAAREDAGVDAAVAWAAGAVGVGLTVWGLWEALTPVEAPGGPEVTVAPVAAPGLAGITLTGGF